MGSRSKKLIDSGHNVIFAFEEAIGFMYGSNVLDKDGVSAAAVMAEFIVELAEKNLTLGDQLEAIYAEYGFHMTNNRPGCQFIKIFRKNGRFLAKR